MSLDPGLQTALRTIGPYLADVVIAGGWVPHIYATQLESSGRGGLLTTRDVDLAVPRTISAREQSIDDLLDQAGFQCEFRSLDTPPVTAYVAAAGQPGEIEIEFITPMARNDERVLRVQSSITAQALRYVEILLENTFPVSLGEAASGGLTEDAWVPTPAAYIFHRLLTYRQRRDRVKREKDLYYAFHVFAAYPKWRERVGRDFCSLAATYRVWFRRARNNTREQFGSIDSPGIDAVAHQTPAGAFAGLNDDQFRQYVFQTMQIMIGVMDEAVVAAASASRDQSR